MRISRKVLSIGLGVLVVALATGCAVAGSTGTEAASPQPEDLAPTSSGTASSGATGSSFEEGSNPVTQPAVTYLSCGDRVDGMTSATGLTVSGEFPDRVSGGGDGTFLGAVTLASTGPIVSGVASPEADVYLGRSGEVVATAPPKDLIGQPVRIAPDAALELPARGSIRPCVADAASGTLSPGRYDAFAVIVITQDEGATVVVTGGPWPIEVT